MSADYATTDGQTINFLFVHKRRPLKKKKTLSWSKHHQHLCTVSGENMSMHEAAGLHKLGKGLKQWESGASGRLCGILDLDEEGTNCFFNALSRSPEHHPSATSEAIQKLGSTLHNRPILSIDLGVRKELTIACIASTVAKDGIVTSDVSRYSISSFTRYDGTGLNRYLDLKLTGRDQTDYENHMNQLSKHHERTMDPLEFKMHMEAFQNHGVPILKANADPQSLKARFHLANKKRSYWAALPNILLALADAKLKRAKKEESVTEDALCNASDGFPIVVIGKPTFKASMRGFRSVAPKKTIEHLAKFFLVVLVDEYNTSKVCATCCKEKLKQVKSTKGTRIWECPSCTIPDKQANKKTSR